MMMTCHSNKADKFVCSQELLDEMKALIHLCNTTQYPLIKQCAIDRLIILSEVEKKQD